jgi:hypothetical protein
MRVYAYFRRAYSPSLYQLLTYDTCGSYPEGPGQASFRSHILDENVIHESDATRSDFPINEGDAAGKKDNVNDSKRHSPHVHGR